MAGKPVPVFSTVQCTALYCGVEAVNSSSRFAILFTVIVEIVPAETRAFCVAVFLFVMNMLVRRRWKGEDVLCLTKKLKLFLKSFKYS